MGYWIKMWKNRIFLNDFSFLYMPNLKLITTAAAPHAPPCTQAIIVHQSSAGWWLAGQINVTGSGYKHAQRRAVTTHTRAAIRSVLLPSVRSATVYTSDCIYSAWPCSLFAADQVHFLSYSLKLCITGFSKCFWRGTRACTPAAQTDKKLRSYITINMCHLSQW